MTSKAPTGKAIRLGKAQASRVWLDRERALVRRQQALKRLPIGPRIQAFRPTGPHRLFSADLQTAGILLAEGDSWFDYPLKDVLSELEDGYGYDVESVAHKGDEVEDMAYGEKQLRDFTKAIRKVTARGTPPKAVLLSGGGNDVAGNQFRMLLEHAKSPQPGLNNDVVRGVVDIRVRNSYVTLLSAITSICRTCLSKPVPILLHGYDYAVPDGRGFMGGWGPLPGPWLDPGFNAKGYGDVKPSDRATRQKLVNALMDRFNDMLLGLTKIPEFKHVQYIDLRGTLPHSSSYKDWWANELHPTQKGFELVTRKFADVLKTLP